jgi:hypothetical protein
MFQVSVVVVLPAVLKRTKTWPIRTPVAEAGVMNAGTPPPPPLTEEFNAPPALPDPEAAAVTALAGMLSPTPSVKAAPPLGTQAHSVTRSRPGFKTQVVWIVLVVLPELDALLGARVKFTFGPPVTFTVSDSDIVAFRTTVPTLEFNCALADGGVIAASKNPAAMTSTL